VTRLPYAGYFAAGAGAAAGVEVEAAGTATGGAFAAAAAALIWVLRSFSAVCCAASCDCIVAICCACAETCFSRLVVWVIACSACFSPLEWPQPKTAKSERPARIFFISTPSESWKGRDAISPAAVSGCPIWVGSPCSGVTRPNGHGTLTGRSCWHCRLPDGDDREKLRSANGSVRWPLPSPKYLVAEVLSQGDHPIDRVRRDRLSALPRDRL
jgi:hypothetical protein